MMIYYAKITRQSKSSMLVEFPGLPGCLTEGDDLPQALANAKEALDGWLAAHCDEALDVPRPTKKRARNHFPVEVDIRVEFAIRLRQMRMKKKLSQADVAKRLGVTQQAYAKLEIPFSTNPSLSTIQKLSRALDMQIDLRLVA